MSRTDKTRPWLVQQADPFERRWYRTDTQQLYPWYRCCSCRTWWCCSTEPNRHARRRSRHQARRECREALKGVIE